jgi:hypothetical protein
VRVCDVYGTGFFYIPGTETCLRIGGYIRYDIGVGVLGHQDVFDKEDLVEGDGDDLNDTYYKRARFQLRVDSRSETELGTLRTYAAINFQYTSNDDGGITDAADAVGIEHAYIELGGFRIGKTDSLFSTFTGYAGGVINDDIVSYGPFGTHQIAYTFTGGNGFSAAVALEMGDGSDGFLSNDYTLDSYVPHVVGGVAWTQGWGGISAVAGYDANWEEWAGKIRLDVNATEQLSLFIMAGYASGADDDFLGVPDLDRPNYYGSWGGDWAVWGGGTFTVSEKTKINVQLSYDEVENFAAVANVNYTLVPGLVITPEIVYVDNFDDDLDDDDDGDEIGGFLRFQRTF